MTPHTKSGSNSRRWFPFAAIFLALSAVFLFFEISLRFFEEPRGGVPLHLFDRGSSYIYSLNPAHPEINSSGLRGPEFSLPKPGGVFRILLLGDSVTHGLFVSEEGTFARKLERLLNQQTDGTRFEVLNAGVNGYTLYNELEYYKAKGAAFEADLVISVFCMNDVADPLAHWGNRKFARIELPPGAVADTEYHRRVAVPALNGEPSVSEKLLSRSSVYRFLKDRFEIIKKSNARYENLEGKRVPVYIADESPLKISILIDSNSREWQWVKRLYGDLSAAVKNQGAGFAIVVHPLAYQLEPGYPYLPQKLFKDYCALENLPCFDPLPYFRELGNLELYMGRHRYHENDIWHLSKEGHAKMADLLLGFINEQGLLPVQRKESLPTEIQV